MREPLVAVPDEAGAEYVLELAAGEAEGAGAVTKPELAGAEEDGPGLMAIGLEAAGALDCAALDAGGAAAEALLPELPELAPDAPPTPLTAAQVPVKVPSPPGVPVTSGPGFGKLTSLPSTEVQPLARLATKRLGRELNPVSRSDTSRLAPAPMVMEAQFM